MTEPGGYDRADLTAFIPRHAEKIATLGHDDGVRERVDGRWWVDYQLLRLVRREAVAKANAYLGE